MIDRRAPRSEGQEERDQILLRSKGGFLCGTLFNLTIMKPFFSKKRAIIVLDLPLQRIERMTRLLRMAGGLKFKRRPRQVSGAEKHMSLMTRVEKDEGYSLMLQPYGRPA